MLRLTWWWWFFSDSWEIKPRWMSWCSQFHVSFLWQALCWSWYMEHSFHLMQCPICIIVHSWVFVSHSDSGSQKTITGPQQSHLFTVSIARCQATSQKIWSTSVCLVWARFYKASDTTINVAGVLWHVCLLSLPYSGRLCCRADKAFAE